MRGRTAAGHHEEEARAHEQDHEGGAWHWTRSWGSYFAQQATAHSTWKPSASVFCLEGTLMNGSLVPYENTRNMPVSAGPAPGS